MGYSLDKGSPYGGVLSRTEGLEGSLAILSLLVADTVPYPRVLLLREMLPFDL